MREYNIDHLLKELPKFLGGFEWNPNIPNTPRKEQNITLVIYPVFDLWAITYWNFEKNGAVLSIEKKTLREAIISMKDFLKKSGLLP